MAPASGLPRRAPTIFHGWYVVGCAFLIAVCGWGFGFYGPGFYLTALHVDHGWPVSQISFAISVYFICGAMWTIFIGDAMERFGPRAVVLVGLLALATGIVMLTLVASPWEIYPGFILMSFGWASMSGAAINTIIAPWFEKKRGMALSLALNGASFGGILVPPLLVVLTTRHGFPTGMWIALGVTLLVMIPTVIGLLRARPEDVGSYPDGEVPHDDGRRRADATAPLSAGRRWRILHERAFLTIAIPFALGLLAQVGFLTHQMSYLVPTLGASGAAMAVSATTAAAVAGRTLAGCIVDKVNPRLVSSANFFLHVAALALLQVVRARPAVYAACVMFGLGIGNMNTLPALIIQREFPRQSFSRVVSLNVSVNHFTFAFGPAVVGSLRDWSGSYRTSLLLCMVIDLLAAMLVLWGRRRE